MHVLDQYHHRPLASQLGEERHPGCLMAVTGRKWMKVEREVEAESEAQDLTGTQATTHLCG